MLLQRNWLLWTLSLTSVCSVNAEATAFARPVAIPEPTVTPLAVKRSPTRTYNKNRRDILSDAKSVVSDATSGIGGAASGIGSLLSGAPSYVASGFPDFYQGLPTGTQVQSSLGINDDDLAAVPTSVQNFPPYANWTEKGWNVRFHGNIYKQPRVSEADLNDRANAFLIDAKVEDLPPSQAAQARNVTAEIFIVQTRNAKPPVFHLSPDPSAGSSGEQGGGGAVEARGGTQDIAPLFDVTLQGDYDNFVPIQSNGLTDGNATGLIQRLEVHTNGTDLGNSTAYLVPPEGLTIVSDIDDILRITKIWSAKDIIFNTFAAPYVPWMNMPDIYRNWSRSLQLEPNLETHFHYLTTLPEQVTRNYEEYIYNTYPGGSFDTRPLNFSDLSATLSIRKFLLTRIFETFPRRKFVLVADTSNSDVMKDYPQMVTDFPGQVQCILLRNTSATDSTDKFPYNTAGFKNLNQQQYMFFVTPDDLMGLDIANGNCYNNSVKQNVTFGYQGLPLGVNLGNGESSAPEGTGGGTKGDNGSGAVMMAGKDGWGARLAFVVAVAAGVWVLA